MNTCDTCKWWKHFDHSARFFPENYGQCRSPRVTTEEAGGDSVKQISRYEFRGQFYDKPQDIPCTPTEFNSEAHYEQFVQGDDDGAWVSAHDYYQADFLTGPKFGCVHWEAKA